MAIFCLQYVSGNQTINTYRFLNRLFPKKKKTICNFSSLHMMTLSIRATPRAVICPSRQWGGEGGGGKEPGGKETSAVTAKTERCRRRKNEWKQETQLSLDAASFFFFFGFHFVYSYARIFYQLCTSSLTQISRCIVDEMQNIDYRRINVLS